MHSFHDTCTSSAMASQNLQALQDAIESQTSLAILTAYKTQAFPCRLSLNFTSKSEDHSTALLALAKKSMREVERLVQLCAKSLITLFTTHLIAHLRTLYSILKTHQLYK